MPSEMRLQNLVPVLDVRDVENSIQFYQSTLGFSVHDKVEWGGRTEWALLLSGQVQLMLCASQNEVNDEEAVVASDNVFFVYIEDMDQLESMLGNSYNNETERPTDSSHSRDFYLRDPDGYVLWFSQRPLGRASTGSMIQNSSAIYA